MTKPMTDKELDELADRVANALDAPDPSPLFWEHFPGRVRAAVAAEPLPALAPARWWQRRPALAFAASLAIAGALTAWAWTSRAPGADDAAQPDAPVTIADADDDAGYTIDLETEDAGWEVVRSVAVTAGVDTLREAGFGVAVGGADAALETMSDAERTELVALLRAEMSGDDSGS